MGDHGRACWYGSGDSVDSGADAMTFDLEAARKLALDSKFYGNAPYLAAQLNAALDEIDRLRKETESIQEKRARQSREIGILKHASGERVDYYRRVIRSDELDEIRQDAKTEYALSLSPEDWRRSLRRLLAHCDYLNCAWVDDIRSHLVIEDRQRAALKKLGQAKRERGKALVEERAMRSWKMALEDPDEDDWEDAKKNARQQLRQDGKI